MGKFFKTNLFFTSINLFFCNMNTHVNDPKFNTVAKNNLKMRFILDLNSLRSSPVFATV